MAQHKTEACVYRTEVHFFTTKIGYFNVRSKAGKSQLNLVVDVLTSISLSAWDKRV